MSFPAPHRSTVMSIEPQWIDYNGHFNMAYYNVLFDRAADQLFELFGLGPEYVKAANCSFFTLETHTSYLRELAPSDTVVVESRILDHDHKRVHYVQEMKHAEAAWVSCVLEVMVSHIDLDAKKTSAFPAEMAAKIAEAFSAHRLLPTPNQVGHSIGIPRRV